MMVKQSSDSPYVYLSAEDCVFEIKGNSFSVRVEELYGKVMKWIKNEVPHINCEMNWVFNFNVISTGTLKRILEIVAQLEQFYDSGKKIRISWICEDCDSDNYEIAKDFLEFTKMPFEIIEK